MRTDNGPGFARRIGQFQATATNMSQMVGVGPFITIPAMVSAFGGPQAMIGWVIGGLLAMADGLIWAELGGSMPRAGGSYIYLREAFQYRTGRLMPFLFVWTAMLFIPIIMSTGVAGFVSYLSFLWPSMGSGQGDLVGLGMVAVVVLLLWRRIDSIGRLVSVLWGIMIVTVLVVIVATLTNFHADLAFTWPADAIELTHSTFWLGLVSGLTIGIYDYLGYNTTSYMGAEIKNPGKIIPRSIIYSIVGIMVIYLAMQIGVLGVMHWQDMLDPANPASKSVASVVLEKAWGHNAGNVVTVLILITAFASVYTGLLGGSRVPYDAARDGVFFKAYGRLHPKQFPALSILTMGAITAASFLISRHLGTSSKTPPLVFLIQLLTTVMVIVQAIAQVAAVTVLRRRQPTLNRPYKMWRYPLPSIVALIGWVAIFLFADRNAPGLHPIELSIAWVLLGAGAFLIWARHEKTWPFGPKEIHEAYLEPDLENA